MIEHLELFWQAITLPLMWMPDYCVRLLEGLGSVFLFLFIANLIYKLVSAIVG